MLLGETIAWVPMICSWRNLRNLFHLNIFVKELNLRYMLRFQVFVMSCSLFLCSQWFLRLVKMDWRVPRVTSSLTNVHRNCSWIAFLVEGKSDFTSLLLLVDHPSIPLMLGRKRSIPLYYAFVLLKSLDYLEITTRGVLACHCTK